MADTDAQLLDNEHKECPFCAEVIKSKATLCRYCKSELPQIAETIPKCEWCGETGKGLDIHVGLCRKCRESGEVDPDKIKSTNDAGKRWGQVYGGRMMYGASKSSNEGQGALVCPHCQQRGNVTARREKVKTGFSTGKAAFAVVTLGTSTLATGLAKKGYITKSRCASCGAEWEY